MRLGSKEGGLRRREIGIELIDLLAGRDVLLDQWSNPLDLAFGVIELGLVALHRSLRGMQFGPEFAVIQREEQVAGLDTLSLLEGDGGDDPVDAGANR